MKNDERFLIKFIAVGQGDFCMIRCPDGKVVVIDCGSTSAGKRGDTNWIYEAIAGIRTKEWAGDTHEIAALILTHPDADHYNKVYDLVRSWNYLNFYSPSQNNKFIKTGFMKALSIDSIYVSSAQKSNPLGKYSGISGLLKMKTDPIDIGEVHEITINDAINADNNIIRSWEFTDNFKSYEEVEIGDTFFEVLKGKTPNKKNWRICIVAGNVPKGYGGVKDKASADNAASLVTMIEFDGKRALFCGDATYSTEKFLLDAHSKWLGTIELSTIPHHGSDYASSQAFVDAVAADHVIGSSEFLEHRFFHPVYDSVLKRWEKHAKTGMEYRYYDAWTKSLTTDYLDKIYNGWVKNKKEIWREGAYYYLAKPEKGAIGVQYMWGLNNMLVRYDSDSSVALTAFGTQELVLDKNGISPITIR